MGIRSCWWRNTNVRGSVSTRSCLLGGLSGHTLLFNDSFYCIVRRGASAPKCTSQSGSRPLPLSPRRRRPSSPRCSTLLCSLLPHFLITFLASALGPVRWSGIRTVCWSFVPPHPNEPRSACSKNGFMACALAADSWNCVTMQVAAFCAPQPHATPGLELVEGPVSRNGQPACQGMSAGPSAWGDASN